MAKLPKPKFYLRIPKGDSETLISLMVSYQGKRLVYSTGCSIHPKDWDFKIQRPINQLKRHDLFAIKRQLDQLATNCVNIFIEVEGMAMSLKEFREQLDIKTGKTSTPESSKGYLDTKEKQPTFFEFIELELNDMATAGMKRGSLKVFKLHTAIIKKFGQEVFAAREFDYEDIDWNFRLKLIDWLAGKNFQLAYGNKTLKVLRQFLEKPEEKNCIVIQTIRE